MNKYWWVSPDWFSAGLVSCQIKNSFLFQGSKAKIRVQLQWRENLQSRVEGYVSMSLQVSLPQQQVHGKLNQAEHKEEIFTGLNTWKSERSRVQQPYFSLLVPEQHAALSKEPSSVTESLPFAQDRTNRSSLFQLLIQFALQVQSALTLSHSN